MPALWVRGGLASPRTFGSPLGILRCLVTVSPVAVYYSWSKTGCQKTDLPGLLALAERTSL